MTAFFLRSPIYIYMYTDIYIIELLYMIDRHIICLCIAALQERRGPICTCLCMYIVWMDGWKDMDG